MCCIHCSSEEWYQLDHRQDKYYICAMNLLPIMRELFMGALIFWSFSSFGQNLIPNGDFDQFVTCPTNHSQIQRASMWDNPSMGTPDFYHRCAGAGPCTTCVPNYLTDGFQEPHAGDGYIAMFTTWLTQTSSIDYREYTQAPLDRQLIGGEVYLFTMYVVMADGCQNGSSVPQIYFSDDEFFEGTVGGYYDLTPQIDFDTVITETENWIELSMCYTATGNEKYITIGNFLEHDEMRFRPVSQNTGEEHPYYLIDDVSLVRFNGISLNPLPDTVVICRNETYEAVLPQGFDVQWSDGSTDNPRIIDRTGKYIVTLTPPCGMILMDTVVVLLDDRLDLNLPDSVFICEGGDILVKPGGEIDTWLWSNGSTADSFLITQPGWVWVEAENPCGKVRDSIFVERILDPVSDLPNDTVFCEGDSLWLTADPELNPVWEGNIQSDSFLITSPGTYILEVSNHCDLVTDIIRVRQVLAPQIELPDGLIICDGDSIQITPTVQADSWQWFDGRQDASRYFNSEGWIWIEATTECGTRRDSVFLEAENAPFSPFGADTVLCVGETWDIKVPDNWMALWSDGSTASEFVIDEAGTYTVMLSNDCGELRDTVEVQYVEPPIADLGPDTAFCTGGMLELTYSGSDDWEWSDGSSDRSFTVQSAGIYYLQVANSCGERRDSITVEEDVPPMIALPDSLSLCEGDSETITPTTNQDYWTWSDGSDAPSYVITGSEQVWVVTTNTCGQASDSTQVVVRPLPSFDFITADQELCIGDSIRLEARSSSGEVIWPDSLNVERDWIKHGGIFDVKVINTCGELEEQVEVRLRNCGCQVFVPNAFTPNGDNINDWVEVFADCPLENLQMQIYTRWGELIYDGKEAEAVWDGRFQGEVLNPGVYVYSVSFEIAGEPQIIGGSVTLIR